MASRTLTRTRADWIRVLERTHRTTPDDEGWATPVNDAIHAVLPAAMGVGMHAVLHAPDMRSGRTLFASTPREIPGLQSSHALAQSTLPKVGPDGFRAYYYPPDIVTTASAVRRSIPRETSAPADAVLDEIGVRDAIGMLIHPEPDVAMVVYACFAHEVTISPYERRLLTQIALHIETAYRLRRRPGLVVGEIRPDGKVTDLASHVTGHASQLSRHASAVERARSKRHRSEADALDLWPALVSGRLGIVEAQSGGQRRYMVVENPVHTRDLRALTKAEAEVVSTAARGLSTKLVGYTLGLSSSTVSARLANAAAKLGVSRRDELVRLAALLGLPRQRQLERATLTEAERDVLTLLRRGMTNQEIAAARSRATRTVANQVASLLRKTNSGSRRELLVRG